MHRAIGQPPHASTPSPFDGGHAARVAAPSGASAVGASRSRVPAVPALSAAAVVVLGFALQRNYGQDAPGVLPPLALALLLCFNALVAPGWTIPSRLSRAILAFPLVASFTMLLMNRPFATAWLWVGREETAFRTIVLAGAAAALIACFRQGRTSRLAGWLLIAAYFSAGVVLLRTVPQPGVDVCTFQRESADALLAGRNPYAITFADPYGPARGFYGADVVRDGRTTWGYPYPPLPLLVAVPGHLLGDFRYTMLAATTLAGVLLLRARPGSSFGAAAASLLLFTPSGFFVIEAGWIEPVVILGLALTVFLACRYGPTSTPATRDEASQWRRAPGSIDLARRVQADNTSAPVGWASVAVAAGLFLATKQYLALALPLLTLLPGYRHEGRTRWAAWAVTAVVGLAVTAPFALWDVGAFVRSVVTLQFHQPFRADALSFLVPLAARIGHAPPAWIPFAAAGLVILLALWRAPRTPAGFSLAVGAVFLAFFAFNKQAFCNYYHFVIAALCCAIAATTAEPSRR